MNRFPMIEWLRALGASYEAMHALMAMIAYMALGVLLAAIVYGICMSTLEIFMHRLHLRDRALDRVRGVRS